MRKYGVCFEKRPSRLLLIFPTTHMALTTFIYEGTVSTRMVKLDR